MTPGDAVCRHFTASAFVTHRGCALLLLHREKHIWLPPGGHVEPDEAPATAAVREVLEETGLHVEITSRRVPAGAALAAPRPEASLEVEVEPGHIHMDLVYFAQPARDAPLEPLRPNEEAAALRWWTPDELRAGDPEHPLGPEVAALALQALALCAGALEGGAEMPVPAGRGPEPGGAGAQGSGS